MQEFYELLLSVAISNLWWYKLSISCFTNTPSHLLNKCFQIKCTYVLSPLCLALVPTLRSWGYPSPLFTKFYFPQIPDVTSNYLKLFYYNIII